MSNTLEPLECRRLRSGVVHDRAYGAKGVADVAFSVPKGQTLAGQQVVTDSAGRAYVCVSTTDADYRTTSYQIERLTRSGQPDTTWAVKNGRLKFAWNEPFDSGNVFDDDYEGAKRFRIAVDKSDRLLVLDGATLDRFTAAGGVDTDFGTGGSVDLSGNFRAVADLTVDPTNHILLVGTVGVHHQPRAAVARLISHGKFDKTFATNGIYTAPAFGLTHNKNYDNHGVYQDNTSYGQDIRVLADGSIVAAADGSATYHSTDDYWNGRGFEGVQALGLTARGRPDKTYGSDGVFESDGNIDGGFGDQYTAVIGVRPDGAVILDSYTDEDYIDGDDQIQDYIYYANAVIARNRQGKVADGLGTDLDPTAKYPFNLDDSADGGGEVYAVKYAGPAAGPYLTLADSSLFRSLPKDSSDGDAVLATIDKTFNAGKALNGIDDFAVEPDGTFVTLQDAGPRSVQLNRYFPSDAPVAGLVPRTLTKPATRLTFDVTYRGATAIATSSLSGNELRVTGPDGKAVRPRLLTTATAADGTITATYRLSAPDGKRWTEDDDGSYAVRLLSGRVKDTAGHAADGAVLGDVAVAVG